MWAAVDSLPGLAAVLRSGAAQDAPRCSTVTELCVRPAHQNPKLRPLFSEYSAKRNIDVLGENTIVLQ